MKAFAAFLVFVCVSMISCKEDEKCVRIHYGKETVLFPGTTYCAEDMAFSFQIEDISDGRCPEGVVCVWQGEAAITLALKGIPEGKVTLTTMQQPAGTIGHYSFQLLEVIPYPKYKQPVEEDDYRVIVRVTNIR
jgi:hypothetical protein